MAATYTWLINNAEVKTSPVNGLDKVIVSCRWQLTASDSFENEAGDTIQINESTFGYASFEEPDPETFVAFESINQAVVLSWVWQQVNKEETELSVASLLEKHKTPPTVVVNIPQTLE